MDIADIAVNDIVLLRDKRAMVVTDIADHNEYDMPRETIIIGTRLKPVDKTSNIYQDFGGTIVTDASEVVDILI